TRSRSGCATSGRSRRWPADGTRRSWRARRSHPSATWASRAGCPTHDRTAARAPRPPREPVPLGVRPRPARARLLRRPRPRRGHPHGAVPHDSGVVCLRQLFRPTLLGWALLFVLFVLSTVSTLYTAAFYASHGVPIDRRQYVLL